MKMVKKIFNATLMGLIGLSLSIVIAPLVAIATVIFMTKTGVEIGYNDKSVEDVNRELDEKIANINNQEYES